MYIQPKLANGLYAAPDYSSNPFINGFRLNIIGLQTFTVTPGAARAYSSDAVIEYNPYRVANLPPLMTASVATHGLNGCYPYAIDQIGTVTVINCGVYVVNDSRGKNPVGLIVATGDNFLPSGYDTWRRISSIILNGTTKQIVPFTQSGYGIDRTYLMKDRIPAANYGPVSFFPLLLSDIGTTSAPANPYFLTEGIFSRELTPATTGDYGSITPTDASLLNPTAPLTLINPVPYTPLRDQVTSSVSFDSDGEAAVYITISSGVGTEMTVAIIGWKETLGLGAI